jgi:hypothetical protein
MHLTADELDHLISGIPAPRATSHCETCHECRRLLDLDRLVVSALATIPRPDPAPGFEDRVMARVTVLPAEAAPLMAPVRSPRELAARRRVAAGSLLTAAAVVAGFVWAAVNPAAAGKLVSPAMNDVGQSLWLWLQAAAANAVEQPWFGTVRDALGSPARAVGILVIVAGCYALMLTGLRHLLTEPAPDAEW